MKKCPYCAEKIQDEAILCRYCGRTLTEKPLPLPTSETSINNQNVLTPKTKSSSSLWRKSAIWGLVLTVLNFFYTLSQPHNSAELIGNLTIGSIVTFVFWTIVFASITWLWMKISGPLTILLIIVFLALGIFAVLNIQNGTSIETLFAPTSTSTNIPRPTKHPTQKPTQLPIQQVSPTKFKITYNGISCDNWSSIDNSDIGSKLCIYGKIYSYGPLPKEGIYYEGWNSIQFSSTSDAFQMIQFNGFYSGSIKVGDCVAIYGKIRDYGLYPIISPENDASGGILIFQTSSVCD